MNHLRTRRQAKKEIIRYTLMSLFFAFLASASACAEFFIWYFFRIPTWLVVMTEALSFMLFICAAVLWEAIEQERGRMHRIFD